MVFSFAIIFIFNFNLYQSIYADPAGSENLPPGVVSNMCKYANNEISDKEFIESLQLAIDVDAPGFPTGIVLNTSANVPEWLRNNVEWWCGEMLSYEDYVNSLAFILDQGVIPEQSDNDGDGIENSFDNCPNKPNSDQKDSDEDGFGDECDNAPLVKNTNQADEDKDSIGDVIDNCLTISNPDQSNRDGDVLGDECDKFPDDPDNDIDNDGIPVNADNCPNIWNADQTDNDNDGIGDQCDSTPIKDFDSDTIPDSSDNCPANSNINQKDFDKDGIGDECDDSDNDGIPDNNDNCPTQPETENGYQDSDGCPDEPPKKDNILWIAIGILGAAVVGVIGFIIYKKKYSNETVINTSRLSSSTNFENGKTCKVCGTFIPDGLNVCPSCGDLYS